MHEIRNPKHSASASIAGHRYAFVCIAHRWLDLDQHSYCLVEGNEDADVVALRPGRESHTEIQYKHRIRPFGPRNSLVSDAIFRFLTAWSSHRAANREFHGLFQTTARFTEQRESAIGSWISGNPSDGQALRRQITNLLKEMDGFPDTLLQEIESEEAFQSFINSIAWRTNCPRLPMEYHRLMTRLQLLVPDLAPSVSGRILVGTVADLAGAPAAEHRRLTYQRLWETLNDSTLDAISATQSHIHSLRPVVDIYSSNGLHAACLLLADSDQVSRFAAPQGWATLSPSDLATDVAKSLDFVCYVAICKTPERTEHCRERVLRQFRFAYPRVRIIGDASVAAAAKVAREVAKRSVEFEVANRTTAPLAPFISKIRWLRLSSGQILTARDLLVLPKTG
jgi:hypothetical protein